MKTNKLLAAGALALSMAMTPVASLLNAMPIAAAEIQYPDSPTTANHTYEIYQIFTGTLDNGMLTNVKWGQNGKGTKGHLVPDATVKSVTDTKESAESARLTAILNVTNLNSAPIAKIDNKAETADIPNSYPAEPGYYLIKDVDNSLEGTEDNPIKNDAYTYYIVKVVGDEDIKITPKSVIPTVDKQVQDEVADKDVKSTDSEGWGETADHDINETFKFKLVADNFLYSEIDRYTSDYKVVLHDTWSAGVDYAGNPVVTVNGETAPANSYTIEQSGKTLTVTFNNIKDLPRTEGTTGYQIVVTYDAKLNSQAYVNTATGSTSNKNEVYLEYSNNPNSTGTGTTEKDEVYVATFQLNNLKVGADETTPLAGAGFKLTKVVSENGNNVTKVATFDENNKVTGWVTATMDSSNKPTNGTEIMSSSADDNKGRFDMIGLDTGTYKLVETTVPAGYTAAQDVEVTISATHEENNFVLTSESTATHKVINKQSVNLPETGGMGTTMIYGVGAVMVAGAAVFYVTNKRTRKD